MKYDHSRAIGLIEGVVQGLEMVGKDANLSGVVSVLKEAIKLIEGDVVDTKQAEK